ncbi:hypothetical protein GCM10022224_009950 [Nonomuraea antimicrobica]|uniref:Uncharacterized protein n=2 Tax=Nonomuraea antimicrobica TaxID=561173 RepID=A0ABP7B6A6_9ACTN
MRAYAEELRGIFGRLQDEGLDLHAKAKAVQVTKTSRDGLVSVTVGARGDLLGVDLDPRVFRHLDARGLADAILGAAREAAAAAQERVMEIFEPAIPREHLKAHLEGDVETVLARLADQMSGGGL